MEPLQSTGGPTASLSTEELRGLVERAVENELGACAPRRVLLVPPDRTRPHSRAGEITAFVYRSLVESGCETRVLLAVGTHHAMTGGEIARLFDGQVAPERVLAHRWRDDLVDLGEIDAEEVRRISSDRTRHAIPVAVSRLLLDGWDLVVSVGQVVPHEVAGMANFTKNLVIGLGGAATIHGTHWLSALCGMETIMGRAQTPARSVVDAAFDRFLAPRLRVLWILTVVEDTGDRIVLRGLFTGRGRSTESGGAAFAAAANLSAACNITTVPEALDRVVCRMHEGEFTSTWVANKAIYRTRMALATGGELVVLAPGVSRFAEDPLADRLVRAHGYRGTGSALRAVDADPDLAGNLGAAAHLIHGSAEGRFRIVYCTAPERGGLSRDDIESVGYEWRDVDAEIDGLGVDAATPTGPRADRTGRPFHFVANPALGLWTGAWSETGRR